MAPWPLSRRRLLRLLPLALGGVGGRGLAARAAAGTPGAGADPLPSWNLGPSREAILAFVRRVTTPGSPDFVPSAERIACFDHDGCLWSEQPMYVQLRFALDRIKALAPQHPEWRSNPLFAAVLRGDLSTAIAGGQKAILEILRVSHTGMTSEEFATIVADWLATARHPRTGLPYTQMVYQPMLELLHYLRAHQFRTFIVSGGGVEFMRVFSERVYGIPPEQTVGSTIRLGYELKDGVPVLMRLPEVEFIDDREGKPIGIQDHIGRRPLAAFGNSDADIPMLLWTTTAPGPRFGLLVHHTDGEREWAYDRSSSFGRLDKGLELASEQGWTVVDMKRDWKRIHPPAPLAGRPASGSLNQSRYLVNSAMVAMLTWQKIA
jgi:hypothetical protein